MKKQKIANIAMVVAVFGILLAGVLAVGSFRGWFQRDTGEAAVLTELRGIVNLERGGLAYPVSKDTVLKAGDRISCGPGATAAIHAGDSRLVLGENTLLEIAGSDAGAFAAALSAGELFADVETGVTLTQGDWTLPLTQSTVLLTWTAEEPQAAVLSGRVQSAVGGEILHRDGRTEGLALTSLSDFALGQMRRCEKALCFTMAELDGLDTQRLAEMQDKLSPTTAPTQPQTEAVATEPEPALTEAPEPEDTGSPEPGPTEAEPEETLPPETQPEPTEHPATQPPATEPPATKPPVTEPPATEPPATEPPETEPVYTCTISIRCDTILNNWDNLDPAKAGYVPSDGVILYPMTVEFTPGDTVFDVLDRTCNALGIQLEYAWTPGYNSYYIEGIHHLYEFDCGSESGWVYCVNGGFPNYGASAYTVQDGDSIVWHYTCVGLGADVGGGW